MLCYGGEREESEPVRGLVSHLHLKQTLCMHFKLKRHGKLQETHLDQVTEEVRIRSAGDMCRCVIWYAGLEYVS